MTLSDLVECMSRPILLRADCASPARAAEQVIDSMGADDQPPTLSSLAALRAACKKATGREAPT